MIPGSATFKVKANGKCLLQKADLGLSIWIILNCNYKYYKSVNAIKATDYHFVLIIILSWLSYCLDYHIVLIIILTLLSYWLDIAIIMDSICYQHKIRQLIIRLNRPLLHPKS